MRKFTNSVVTTVITAGTIFSCLTAPSANAAPATVATLTVPTTATVSPTAPDVQTAYAHQATMAVTPTVTTATTGGKAENNAPNSSTRSEPKASSSAFSPMVKWVSFWTLVSIIGYVLRIFAPQWIYKLYQIVSAVVWAADMIYEAWKRGDLRRIFDFIRSVA